MTSPWLRIPLEDYERHMAMPAVAQAQLLADLLGDAVAVHTPRALAVIGCAGGNGFDRIPADVRVVAVDINADYVETARRRHGGRLAALECIVADVEAGIPAIAPVDLVHVALVFEYVDPARVLPVLRGLLRPGGVLVSVVQLGSAGQPSVTPTPFASLETLSARMRLVDPAALERAALAAGFVPAEARTVRAGGGKEFHVQVFGRE